MTPLPVFLAAIALLTCKCAQAEGSPQLSEQPVHGQTESQLGAQVERPVIFADLSLLFRLQDASAAGDPDAISAQKQLLPILGKKLEAFFNSASPEQMRLVAPDVASYVLSGGDSDVAAMLAERDSLDDRMRSILNVAAVFMQGDRDAAQKTFKNLDTQGLPMRLMGRLALVQALLENENENQKQDYLARAMAAMPGSLIEESALRRSALAYADVRDERRFWQRIARYHRRFPNSAYAPAFWRDISDAIIVWSAKEPGVQLDRLDNEWKSLEVSQRRSLYLRLTRRAAAANEREVAEFAASRLQRISPASSPEDQVARLYMAIYRIASPQGEDAWRGLKSVRRAFRDEQDRQLLNAALFMSNQISRPLPAASLSSRNDSPEEDALLARGQSAILESDKILEGLSL